MSSNLVETRRKAKVKTMEYRDHSRADLALEDLIAEIRTGTDLDEIRAYAEGVEAGIAQAGDE